MSEDFASVARANGTYEDYALFVMIGTIKNLTIIHFQMILRVRDLEYR